jgi:osmoprotectant transport system permease protein
VRAGLLERLQEHLTITGFAVLMACLVGWPIGVVLGHRGRAGDAIRLLSHVMPAVPAVALLTILPLTPLGFGLLPVVVALAVGAVPPLVAHAYAGLRQVDPQTRDAARAMGLSGGQVFRRVELPIAGPHLVAGLRAAVGQVIATAALAAFVNGGGLGQIIRAGFEIGVGNGGAGQIVAGGIVLAGLALIFQVLLAGLQRVVTPARSVGRLSSGLRSPAAAEALRVG